MFIRLVVQEALKSLASHWVRTTLTMFGILWGIATVIILVAIVQGFYESSKRSIRALGANTIRIEYQDTYKDGDAVYALRGDPSDAHLIKESIPYVRRAVPYISTWTQMQGSLPYQEYGGIVATTSEITEIRELEVEQGRFFNPVDEKLAAPRVVIGGWINERFFANQAKLGDTIRISYANDPIYEIEDGLELLYTLGKRERIGAELIACPTCGRIQVDLFTLVQQVNDKLSADITVPMKVAVMGCVVNGPGEAEGADVAVFAGDRKGIIYVQGEKVATVPETEILDRLLSECKAFQEQVLSGAAKLGEKKVEIVPPDPEGALGSGWEKMAYQRDNSLTQISISPSEPT